MSTPTQPAAALWNELIKAVAAEVIRLQSEHPEPTGLMEVSTAAKQVGRHPKTVKQWMNAGLLRKHVIAKRVYVDRREFAALLTKPELRRRRSLQIA